MENNEINVATEFMTKSYKIIKLISDFIPSLVYRFNNERTDCLVRCPLISRQVLLTKDNVEEKLENISELIGEWYTDYAIALREEVEDNARCNGKR